jgi:uncharacterized oligopeptide transporter (OPT) family protein
VFKLGLDSFHPMAQHCIVVGLALGVVLALIERYAPARLRRFVPSATGIGLGMILPFYIFFAMFLGALFAHLVERFNRGWADRYSIAVASGLIAGESIIGVLVAALNTFLFS